MTFYLKLNKTVLFIVIGIGLLFGIFTGNACASSNQSHKSFHRKEVTTIVIQNGDTLWDIACTYYTPYNQNISDYIREIKQCNNLSSDKIHTGNHLIIPYYIN